MHDADLNSRSGPETETGGTLCYAIVLPGRKSAVRAGFWPDCYRESTGSSPVKIRPGRPISCPEALLRNIE